MSAQQNRVVFGFLMAGLAIAGAFFLVRGLKQDSLSLAVGVMSLAILLGLVGWRKRSVAKEVSSDAEALGLVDPKSALAPPDGHIRFTIVVDNLTPVRVAELWSELCQPDRDATEAFRLMYRNFTVQEGNRFRFLKGDPQEMARLLTDVLSTVAGIPVRTSLEPAADRTPLWS